MKIVFMGTPEYAEAILRRLIDAPDMEVVAVYTQPDKPVGRKKTMTPPPVKVLAEASGIPVVQPYRLRDEAVVETLRATDCDFIVVAAYGQILPIAVLEHAPCINLHASILPQYRGASPIQQSLLNGDTHTGVTAMRMDEGLDTGDILEIVTLPIGPDETAPELYARLSEAAAELTPDVLRRFDTLEPRPQNDAEATHCTKIRKEDGQVTFESDARSLYNRYRAFTPWPGLYLPGGLKLTSMTLASEQGEHAPGEILAMDAEGVEIGCAQGSLRVQGLQPPSKKAMRATDYLNGKRLGVADTLA